jgi:hypothetical protein
MVLLKTGVHPQIWIPACAGMTSFLDFFIIRELRHSHLDLEVSLYEYNYSLHL